MGIDHDMVFGSLGDAIEIVVVDRLAIVMLTTWDDVADISTLDGVIAILVHQVVCSPEMSLVVLCRSRRLMMHHQFDTLGMGIVIEGFDIEVWVWRDKVKDIVLAVSVPVLPSLVPSFNEHFVEMVLSSKVYVFSYLSVVGAMTAVGLHFCIIGFTELYRRQVVGIVPSVVAGNHFPPHTAVFHGMDPRSVLDLARFVEIERELAGEHVTGIIADKHRAPRSLTRRLHIAFHAGGIRRKPALKDHILVIEVEVHGRIVHAGGLVNVDIQPVVCLHL